MSLVIIGSTAYDTVETPTDSRERVPGGSGFYSAAAAGFLTRPRLVGVVGDDWNQSESDALVKRGVDIEGLEIRKNAKTLYWSGRYFNNMNERETRDIQLNVMGTAYDPIVPESWRDSDYVFLANGGPGIHLSFLSKLKEPKLVVADTMDFYIQNARDELLLLLKKIDGLIVNDQEAKLLTGASNCITAGKEILKLGPRFVIVKKGEHGALFISKDAIYLIPAYPTEVIIDPTGAGDSFAGGLMGHLARRGTIDAGTIKEALAYATVIASFCVEGFSIERYNEITLDTIESRYREFVGMIAF